MAPVSWAMRILNKNGAFINRLPNLVHKSSRNTSSQQTGINDAIASGDIVMFSKTTCPYCTAANGVLSRYSTDYKVVELNTLPNGHEMQRELQELTDSSTVPQIFVHQNFIGGATDLMRLHSDDQLQDLIDNRS